MEAEVEAGGIGLQESITPPKVSLNMYHETVHQKEDK